MEWVEVSTGRGQALYDISDEIQDVLRRSVVVDGICVLFCPHTTAGLTLNENWDPDVPRDIGTGLDAISPHRPQYRHAEGNSPAHLKASLVGASVTLLVSEGKMVLGTWQGVYLAEFDGPRRRRIAVKVVAD
jgi:secondary thiamine-phosphate synthase enzyme